MKTLLCTCILFGNILRVGYLQLGRASLRLAAPYNESSEGPIHMAQRVAAVIITTPLTMTGIRALRIWLSNEILICGIAPVNMPPVLFSSMSSNIQWTNEYRKTILENFQDHVLGHLLHQVACAGPYPGIMPLPPRIANRCIIHIWPSNEIVICKTQCRHSGFQSSQSLPCLLLYCTPPNADPKGDYLVDHSIFVYLMDPNGEFVEAFGQNVKAEEIIERVGKEIAEWEAREGKKIWSSTWLHCIILHYYAAHPY